MKRVMIIGGSGSGKSWLAARLAGIADLPIVHIDKFYFYADWVMRPRTETQSLIRDAALRDRWIIEGNNSETYPERLARADHFIVVDFSTWTRLRGAISRWWKYRGTVRPDMAAGCPEHIDLEFLIWVASYGGKRRQTTLKAMRDVPPTVTVVHLKSRRQAWAYVENLRRTYHVTTDG